MSYQLVAFACPAASGLLNFDSLFSGLFGVLVGALVSFRLVRLQQAIAAKARLAFLLFRVGKDLETSPQMAVSSILDPVYIDLMAAFSEVQSTLVWKRRAFMRTAGLLLGHMRVIEKNPTLPRHSFSYPGRDDAQRHVETLLQIIGYKN